MALLGENATETDHDALPGFIVKPIVAPHEIDPDALENIFDPKEKLKIVFFRAGIECVAAGHQSPVPPPDYRDFICEQAVEVPLDIAGGKKPIPGTVGVVWRQLEATQVLPCYDREISVKMLPVG